MAAIHIFKMGAVLTTLKVWQWKFVL